MQTPIFAVFSESMACKVYFWSNIGYFSEFYGMHGMLAKMRLGGLLKFLIDFIQLFGSLGDPGRSISDFGRPRISGYLVIPPSTPVSKTNESSK